MSELIEKLRNADCDVDMALARFVDDVELYTEYYAQLLNDEGFELLGDALNDGNKQEAFDHAHALKGIIGNMGLTPLYEIICDIVEPLRIDEDDDVYENYEKLLEQKEFFSKFII